MMLAALALVRLSCSTCREVKGLTTRTSPRLECLDISDSHFANLEDSENPVITAVGFPLLVSTSTFYRCTTTGAGIGGAIRQTGFGELTVRQCCLRACNSRGPGFGISAGGQLGVVAVETSFVSCGLYSALDGRGTIYQERPLSSGYELLNLSSSRLNPSSQTVAGIECDLNRSVFEKICHFSLSWSTFVNCSSRTIILDRQPPGEIAVVNSSNFLFNDVGESGSILGSTEAGMRVSNCVFAGDRGYCAEICSLGSLAVAADRKYEFDGCAFPASTPNPRFARLAGSAPQDGRPTVLIVGLFGTSDCPAAPPRSGFPSSHVNLPYARLLANRYLKTWASTTVGFGSSGDSWFLSDCLFFDCQGGSGGLDVWGKSG
jgi:hypothetical protein